MKEKKWTPGDWYADGEGIRRVVRASDGRILAVRHRAEKDEHVANMNLMASAPGLYEALDRLVDASNPEISGWSEAVDALAKARGEQ